MATKNGLMGARPPAPQIGGMMQSPGSYKPMNYNVNQGQQQAGLPNYNASQGQQQAMPTGIMPMRPPMPADAGQNFGPPPMNNGLASEGPGFGPHQLPPHLDPNNPMVQAHQQGKMGMGPQGQALAYARALQGIQA